MPESALRGGSWNNNARNARAAYRNNNQPDNLNDNNGFRLVVAHASVARPANPHERICCVPVDVVNKLRWRGMFLAEALRRCTHQRASRRYNEPASRDWSPGNRICVASRS
jgi:hypothetical protein